MTIGRRWIPIIRGIENPHTSASSSATRRPWRAMATARLAASDDLPTPPLPEAMAMTRDRPSTPGASWSWSCRRSAARSAAFIAVRSTSTCVTPSPRTATVDVGDELLDRRVVGDRQGERHVDAPVTHDARRGPCRAR